MDGSKFWCFPWSPENSLLCVILRYTVYIMWQSIVVTGLKVENNYQWIIFCIQMKERIISNYWFTTTLQISPWGQSCLLWNVSNKSSNCPSYGVGWERAFCCVIPRPLTALMFADRKIKRRAVIFVDNLHFVVYITEMMFFS